MLRTSVLVTVNGRNEGKHLLLHELTLKLSNQNLCCWMLNVFGCSWIRFDSECYLKSWVSRRVNDCILPKLQQCRISDACSCTYIYNINCKGWKGFWGARTFSPVFPVTKPSEIKALIFLITVIIHMNESQYLQRFTDLSDRITYVTGAETENVSTSSSSLTCLVFVEFLLLFWLFSHVFCFLCAALLFSCHFVSYFSSSCSCVCQLQRNFLTLFSHRFPPVWTPLLSPPLWLPALPWLFPPGFYWLPRLLCKHGPFVWLFWSF